MFHNNFWCYVDLDPATGKWAEHENLLPTPAALMSMADPAFMADQPARRPGVATVAD